VPRKQDVQNSGFVFGHPVGTGMRTRFLRLRSGQALRDLKLLFTFPSAEKRWASSDAPPGLDSRENAPLLIRKKDGAKFPDWDLELKPGAQEFVLKVPSDPGEYEIVCTVICSEGHEDMHMKVIVIA
jgi:hypothetical protein